MQVVGLGRGLGELGVVALFEPLQIGVPRLHVRDTCNAQFFHQTILQRAIGPFYAALGLARISAQNLDVEFTQRPAKLRDPRTALGVCLGHAEHSVLVGIERNRAAVIFADNLRVPRNN